jgi:4a-hydroxytetrahydrobiopterin dehydratase
MTAKQEREEQSVDMRAKTCTPCGGGIPPLTPQEALSFIARVGEVAEAEGHHPDIRFGWGYATVSLQTKKIDGLHDNDFIVAAKIDHLLKEADERLDQAIAMTFPASDPIAVGRPTGIEQEPRSQRKTGKAGRRRKT